MKRILIFSLTYYPKFIGGDGVAIKEITDRIDPSDIEFHMITLRLDSTLPKVEQLGNVLIHRIGCARPNPSATDLKRFPLHYTKALFQFTAVLTAYALHRRYHYDGVWAMMAHSSGVPAALFKILNPRVPYLLTLQEGDPPEYIEKVMRPLWPLFSRAFTRADFVQTISNFLGDWARRRGFAGPLEVIPNGVEVKHFAGDPIPHEGTILITTSRLVHKNAVDDVIRALKFLPKDIRFRILGVGPDENMLKELVQKEGVSERVEFLGHTTHKDMPRYLHSADIFVRPSRSEGMGNSFVEAMAAGLPVIATQEGGIADFLFDVKRNPDKEPTGWAVDKDSPKQIAEAVTEILGNPEQTKKVINNAQKLATEKYDWDLLARDMRQKVFGRVFNLS
ncbi:glycosyltransferase family 4 protein [Acetobacteraceae bacterium]|nr:glycosyltransferase family 4 protein [Candidatus Parcubacteria bacterium]